MLSVSDAPRILSSPRCAFSPPPQAPVSVLGLSHRKCAFGILLCLFLLASFRVPAEIVLCLNTVFCYQLLLSCVLICSCPSFRSFAYLCLPVLRLVSMPCVAKWNCSSTFNTTKRACWGHTLVEQPAIVMQRQQPPSPCKLHRALDRPGCQTTQSRTAAPG